MRLDVQLLFRIDHLLNVILPEHLQVFGLRLQLFRQPFLFGRFRFGPSGLFSQLQQGLLFLVEGLLCLGDLFLQPVALGDVLFVGIEQLGHVDRGDGGPLAPLLLTLGDRPLGP